MGAIAFLQKEITVTGDTSAGDVQRIQPMDGWLDMLNWADAVITIQTYTVNLNGAGDTADIMLATTDTKRAGVFDIVPNGPIWDAWTESSIASDQFYKKVLTLEDATVTGGNYPVERWLNWVLTVHKSTGGTFSVTFEITVTAKNPA